MDRIFSVNLGSGSVALASIPEFLLLLFLFLPINFQDYFRNCSLCLEPAYLEGLVCRFQPFPELFYLGGLRGLREDQQSRQNVIHGCLLLPQLVELVVYRQLLREMVRGAG